MTINPDPYPSGIYSVLSYPMAAPQLPTVNGTAPPAEEIVARVGDIALTQSTVHTPAGAAPLGAVAWQVDDERIIRVPTWAVVGMILGFFVAPLLNLLFLLARETVATGTLHVVVSAGDLRHATRATDPDEVALARSLAAGNPSTVN